MPTLETQLAVVSTFDSAKKDALAISIPPPDINMGVFSPSVAGSGGKVVPFDPQMSLVCRHMATHGNNLFPHWCEEEGRPSIGSTDDVFGANVAAGRVDHVAVDEETRIAPPVVEMTPHTPSASCIPARPSVIPQPPFSLGNSSK
ncbi:hypothetical protein ARMSODRAFT_1025300 [Armillaria solidipes]|uniref:Uncharacterized protein n=1 Tax=Armillaria solidipes TaxID=1076256 RepID=A0A2H3B7F1_9AGAR|nr:hypothetical protein ARMSODRAFT_1025300 [Armillaria solidipes]